MTKEEFQNIYQLYFDAIRNYMYYRSGDAELATDIAQETFLTVWQKNIRQHPVKPLLYKIAGDIFVNTIRKNKVAEVYAQDFKLRFSEGEENSEDDQEQKQQYEKALAKLPDQQRVALLMNKMEGLTYKEIAESLGLSVKAIEKRISTALKFLRTEVKQTQAG